MCGEVAEEIQEESWPRVWSSEGGEGVGFLGPVVGVRGCSVGWGDPICVFRNFWWRVGTSGDLPSPEGAGKCDIDLKQNVR